MTSNGSIGALRFTSLFLALGLCAGTLRGQVSPADTAGPPRSLLGQFADDYGNLFGITPTAWDQFPSARYHVLAWHTAGQYLIAQNDSANPGQGGRWTRIDWLPLEGMAPYTWAFCFSAYDAATPEAAEQVTTARRETPKTGCNGYPFSRMRPAMPNGN